MNRLHFVYCPQSGPNWLGEAGPRAADSPYEIPMATPAVVWPNKSAHVYGTGLSWEPGTRAGRAELGKLLEALAIAAGGVAWDVRGQLCIVVPSYLAGDISEAVDSVSDLLNRGIASTPEQRSYETAGPQYWAERIEARNWDGAHRWSATCETHDRAGDVAEDGTQGPTIRYTRITWQHPREESVEVSAPWEPAEMYPRPEAEPAEAAPEQPPAGASDYQASREGQS